MRITIANKMVDPFFIFQRQYLCSDHWWWYFCHKLSLLDTWCSMGHELLIQRIRNGSESGRGKLFWGDMEMGASFASGLENVGGGKHCKWTGKWGWGWESFRRERISGMMQAFRTCQANKKNNLLPLNFLIIFGFHGKKFSFF